jgi:hypothetical protein
MRKTYLHGDEKACGNVILIRRIKGNGQGWQYRLKDVPGLWGGIGYRSQAAAMRHARAHYLAICKGIRYGAIEAL